VSRRVALAAGAGAVTAAALPTTAVELSVCRELGPPLVGPPPRDVIGEIPADSVLSYGDSLLTGWELLTGDAEHGRVHGADGMPDLALLRGAGPLLEVGRRRMGARARRLAAGGAWRGSSNGISVPTHRSSRRR
jgi:hypothetical protein